MKKFLKVFLYAVTILTPQFLIAQQPNIIFFYVDDLGYGDLGSFWQDGRSSSKKFDTPALDTMAAEGIKLTHHYTAAPVCAPARSSLLQGVHQGHADIRDNQFDNPLPDGLNLANMLQAAGYRTIHIGKSGLAGQKSSVNLTGTGSQNLPAHPLHRGFDRFFGYLFHRDGHEHYPRNGTSDKQAHIYDDYTQINNASLDLYTTDAWTAFAKQAIIDEVDDGDNQPFFLYLAYDTPHFKMQRPAVAYPGEDLANGNHNYGLNGGIQWTTSTDAQGRIRYANTADGNGSVDGYTHPEIPSSWSNPEKQHVGMIRRIDNSVADILQLLKDLNIDNNTICVFSSDNGPHNEGNDPRAFESYANMEGVKRDLWEAGIRVPAIVRWPGHIPSATNDENDIAELDMPSAVWDWMPTFADAAGVEAPAQSDGVSLLPSLTGVGTQREHPYLYFEYYFSGSTPNWSQFPNHRGESQNQMQAIRIGDFMGIRVNINSVDKNFRIYNVVTDPGQSTDLAASMPDLEQEMQDIAIQARRPGAVTRSYIDSAPKPAGSTPPPGTGITYTAYEGTWSWVPQFLDLPASATGTVANLDLSVRTAEDNIGILYEGYIHANQSGTYTFYLDSDNGSDLFIQGSHVIANDYNFDASEKNGSVVLEAGWHAFSLYYTHVTGPHQLDLSWSGPGISKQIVPEAAFNVPGGIDPEPVAINDYVSVSAGSSVSIPVLNNDLDDGFPSSLSIESVSQPIAGNVSISGENLIYTPNANFYGRDEFSYSISDSEYFATAQVFVDVTYFDANEVWLPLNLENGLTVSDAGGSQIGTAFGFADPTSPWTSGYSGNAIQLNGSSQYVLLDASYTPPSGSSPRTVTAWIKATGTGAIVAWGEEIINTNSIKWHWRLENDSPGTGALRIEVQGGYRTGSTDLRDNQWHHVAVVLPDGANNVNQVKLYVDGIEETYVGTVSQTINTTATRVMIGKDDHQPTNRYFEGTIDEVRIYKRALSASEISAQAASGNLLKEVWHRDYFGPANVDWTIDDDDDGFNRYMELALGGNPHKRDEELLEPVFELNSQSGHPTLAFQRRTEASFPITYVVEVSNDLSRWDVLSSSEISSILLNADEKIEKVIFESNSNLIEEPTQFMRLKVDGF